MTEVAPTPESSQRSQLNDLELMALGELCATTQIDINAALATHTELMANPNDASGTSMFRQGEIPTQDGFAYRQVGHEAIQDLAESGIVRNGATARGEEHPRWGHRVFWSRGQEGTAVNTGGRFVIEAPLEAVQAGWIGTPDVSSIYTKMDDGSVANILPKQA